jgi:hypothetical protein
LHISLLAYVCCVCSSYHPLPHDFVTLVMFHGLPQFLQTNSRIAPQIRSVFFVRHLQYSGFCFTVVGRDSSVGIATRYGLDGPGVESLWERDFPPVQTGPGAHPAFCTMGTGSFPGVKRPGRGVEHPPTSSAEVKERVQLCLYSRCGPLWPVLW